MRGGNDTMVTINAAASAIQTAENRGAQSSSASSVQKRRWGSCWNISWCFRSQKQSKRIGHAVLVPEPGSSRNEAPSATNMSQQPSIVHPFIAPPSSPASFLQSEPPSATHSPGGFLSFTSVSASMYSPGGPANIFALSFSLKYLPMSHLSAASSMQQSSSLGSSQRLSFKYSMALIVSLPIGTPPQAQQMVLDTGSQLSWIQCHNKTPTTSFDPSLSSSFSILPCNHPICKPRVPDFTLPTTCDQNRLCHYSYFYADGTLAEGNLVREKVTFSRFQSTPPVALGCAAASDEPQGILGMNLGRLSFASQAKISKFSYCTPTRQNNAKVKPSGAFYLGQNPNSGTFKYVDMLTFPGNQHSPNFDQYAFTIGVEGIRIGGKRLNIPRSVFRPDAGGSGQTMIDSGTEYTYLVDEAYKKIREEILRTAGSRLKKGYVYRGSLDLCFNGNSMEIGRLIGDMVFEFEKGVEMVMGKQRLLDDVGRGISCLGIGPSERLGVPSNIIGNFHQQNQWVEFDMVKRRVGFGAADCSKS